MPRKRCPKMPNRITRSGSPRSTARDVRTAVAAFRKALELNPKHAGAQLHLAELMAMTDDQRWLNDAESRLKALMECSPVTPEMLNTLALTEMKLGKTENAVDNLEQVLAKAPQELTSSILLARAKLLQRDVKGAEDVLKKAAAAKPNAADPHVVLGRVLCLSKQGAGGGSGISTRAPTRPPQRARLDGFSGARKCDGPQNGGGSEFQAPGGLPDKTYRPVYALFLFERAAATRRCVNLKGWRKKIPRTDWRERVWCRPTGP